MAKILGVVKHEVGPLQQPLVRKHQLHEANPIDSENQAHEETTARIILVEIVVNTCGVPLRVVTVPITASINEVDDRLPYSIFQKRMVMHQSLCKIEKFLVFQDLKAA